MRTHCEVTPRKGVVLLLTLAILSVFGLIVLAYVVLTGHTRRGAEAAKRFQEQYDPPEQTVMQAALEVIRGSTNPRSSIWSHSLLEDIYGDRFQLGVISDPVTFIQVAGGQLWGFPASFTQPELRTGCPLTFLTGPVAGITTRIVDYDPASNRLLVVAPQTVGYAAVRSALQSGQAVQYLINGRPFSGTGVGFNNTETLGRADLAGRPYALLPNPTVADFLAAYAGPDGIIGTDDDEPMLANEDYDAVDYQNMFLAMLMPDPITGEPIVPEPSFHRVALIAYWFNQAIYGNAINWGSVNQPLQRFQCLLNPDRETIPDPQLRKQVAMFERKFILRPLRAFHPNFDGGNSSFQPGLQIIDLDGDGQPDKLEYSGPPWPWDVDNDGDGVPDSIWVDVGLPVRQLPDGRRYKPLAAILCVDLDGRLNLNAHGNLVQTDPRYYQPDTLNQDGLPTNAPWLLVAGQDINGDGFPDGATTLYPPTPPQAPLHWFRGLGFGPAEVNLGPLFQILTASAGPSGAWQPLYRLLLVGRVDPVLGPIAGRYGEWTLLSGPNLPSPGLFGQPDFLLSNKFFTFPPSYPLTLPSPFGPGAPTIYGSPPDMEGLMTVGLDLRGRPLYAMPQALWTNALLRSPYKLNLSPRRSREVLVSGQKDSVDAPFSPSELEAVLRPFDADSRDLAPRLRQLVPDLARVRHLVTTESWDVPVPGVAGSHRWRSQRPTPSPGAQQVTQHILERFNLPPNDLWRLLPPDVLAGLKMNLNRPLGDGLDNNNNGVVDEPLENLSGTEGQIYQTPSGPAGPVAFDYDSDGLPGATEDPREAMARHLYVLMMAVADLQYLDGLTGSRLKTARMLAQWAVNVVDFRDRDSIMTRFVFDENPFDGWNPLPNAEHTVWGCERPELIITETLAFHDRRTEDLSAYGYAYPPTANDQDEADYPQQGQGVKDLDQRYRPQGSLFVELYNPWFENEPVPGEFDNPNNNRPEARPGVDLAKTNPNGEPVWRMIVTTADTNDDETGLPRDPDDPDATRRPTVERAIYFIERPANGFPDEGSVPVNHYPGPNYAPTIGKILPGYYGLIGPAGRPDNDYTFIGFQGDQADPNVDRYIRILENAVVVQGNDDTPPAGIKAPVGIRLDRGFVTIGSRAGDKELRLSVSEPLTGYDELEANNVDENGQPIEYNPATGRYERAGSVIQVIDQPLDAQRTYANASEDWDNLFGLNTTRTGYRMIHLQRLADPTRPYDPVTNPYRTIDSAPIDLTCFNGRTNREDFSVDGQSQLSNNLPVMFHTRQRGERNDDPPTLDSNSNPVIDNNNRDYILWKEEPLPKPLVDDPANITLNAVFRRKLKHTLGYLGEYFGQPRQGPAPYNGDPIRPFPWLTWLNRPYTSPTELLLVPALPASRLLAYDANNYYKYYRVPRDQTNPAQDLLPYQPDPTASADSPEAAYDPYPHLTNYFWSVGAGTTGPAAPEFHRVLEFVRVPSPFVDTELQLNPVTSQLVPPPPDSPRHRFTPPYNSISYWREPGRINLNTIYSPEVFRGLMNQPYSITNPPVHWDDLSHPLVQLWYEFIDSRRNYLIPPQMPGVPDPWGRRLLSLNPDYPTRMANPFRGFGGYSNVPPTNPLHPSNVSLQERIAREVNATLLREKAVVDPTSGEIEFNGVPLFQSRLTDDPTGGNPPTYELEYCDINRNPFFRYRDLMRLGNLVTTRSNVYAIWITIGYFEVEPADPAALGMPLTPAEIQEIYPDGYMLGQELGSDTGDIKRHRGFFIFDRSIPVGFRRGYDLNVDQGLLIRRILE